MPKRFVPRVLLGLIVVAVAASLGVASATPAFAYGKADWQLTFSATAPTLASGDGAIWPVPRALTRRAW
jgi:hypothetical protein